MFECLTICIHVYSRGKITLNMLIVRSGIFASLFINLFCTFLCECIKNAFIKWTVLVLEADFIIKHGYDRFTKQSFCVQLKKETQATFTIVRFRFIMHNFCYGYACRLHYSGVFDPRKRRLSNTLQTTF